jgi:NSS family neurotransmitter:Na+ symporter
MSNNLFSSRIGFILAAAGSAIGLGNIWRFPYLVMEEGGSNFIFLYFLCIFFIGVPLLVVEFTIGRSSQNKSSLITIFQNNHKLAHLFSRLSYIFLFTLIVIISYYSVVAGWVLIYFVKSLFGLISYQNESINYYKDFLQILFNSNYEVGFATIFIIIFTLSINFLGITKGIERFNFFMLPLLFIILIVMIFKVLTLNGSEKGLHFLIHLDLTSITYKNIFAALGQSFFSLSLGMGVMIVYASYLNKKESIINNSIITAFLGSVVGIFSSLIIIPIIFAFNQESSSGVGLTMLALPSIFSQISHGSFYAILFFGLMLVAALTSTISIVEPLLNYTTNKFKISKLTACFFVGISIIFLSIIQINSFNNLSHIKIFNQDIFTFTSGVFSDVLLSLGSIIACIYCGFILTKSVVLKEINQNNQNSLYLKIYQTVWLFSIKYLIPLILLYLGYKSLSNLF